MSTGTFNASIFSVVLVFVILLKAYHSLALTLTTLFTLALGMVFCAGFAAFSLRLNAGGMLNTCKSNGNRPSGADEWRTGA